MNAIQFVFEKIGAPFKKLVDWLSFIFEWAGILETMDGIVSMVDGMLTFGETFLTETAADAVESFFSKLRPPSRGRRIYRQQYSMGINLRCAY